MAEKTFTREINGERYEYRCVSRVLPSRVGWAREIQHTHKRGWIVLKDGKEISGPRPNPGGTEDFECKTRKDVDKLLDTWERLMAPKVTPEMARR